MKFTSQRTAIAVITAALAWPAIARETLEPVPGNHAKTQQIRFVEDDAQNYMGSKIYELKHQTANNVVPFVLGAIKRYARNGSADRIHYKAGNRQLVAVSCPRELIPHLDDMIAKLDRPGAAITGTGISRSIYTPQYRGSEKMMNVMIKAGIPSNATEGANQDATVAFDAPTNRIYWKDSGNKDADMKKYLVWLDRPVPQVQIAINVYELRESDLLDLGIDYLAWKNGPGLNLFDAGAKFLEGSAIADSFGPYGFFMFAPSFDLSFVRILQQNGKARIASSARLTVATGHNAELSFSPDFQNLTKDAKFASAVVASNNDRMVLKITDPVIAMTGATNANGQLGSSEEAYAEQLALLNFSYQLDMKTVVERNNHGDELYESGLITGAVSVRTGAERLLSRWHKLQEVEQTIGVPFLCELPILKYIFGTTTRSREKYFYFMTVQTELLHPDADIAQITGKLVSVHELLNLKENR